MLEVEVDATIMCLDLVVRARPVTCEMAANQVEKEARQTVYLFNVRENFENDMVRLVYSSCGGADRPLNVNG